jgi:hypothetical protein
LPKGFHALEAGPAAVLAAVVLSPASSLAGVNVRFVSPGRYTDAGSFGASHASTEAALRARFECLEKRFLAPGQTLRRRSGLSMRTMAVWSRRCQNHARRHAAED